MISLQHSLPEKKLIEFLREEQGVTVHDDALLMAKEIISVFSSDPSSSSLLFSDFSFFLSSPLANNLMIPQYNRIMQPMSEPLTNYFINSSHNTYLEGDQLKSDSSTQAYINAFLLGQKCVEIDIWDGVFDISLSVCLFASLLIYLFIFYFLHISLMDHLWFITATR